MTVVKIKSKKHKKEHNKKKTKTWKLQSCLEATQYKNKINHLGKNKIDIDSPKKS